ncbi:hypothetical protein AAT17_02015 [Nonlabens sp. MIC269]|uniref:hypothetical protein n=1 Tax=Nonlabens TaxID=363408 RepID=UPI00071F8BCE|nr:MULTISPECIES: hypothetical protein [Nonlabens]ALM20112.1 hypothetical protein AAT17_02015 [Nonlabens sp. MIC269]ARN70849.1 hypothetical protein BST91_03885 [Nonlabens tegetincola]MEE2800747.1 hypothetical protein [Bacteroidota bacterium]
MDQLDILKENWKQQEKGLPKFSTTALSSMLHKKSSNIVKWLLYIALIEFALLTLVSFLPFMTDARDEAIEITGESFHYGTYVFSYIALIIFVYLFYRNYRRISAVQPVKELLRNIIITRKTMRAYIWFNLAFVFVYGVIFSVLMLENDPRIYNMVHAPSNAGHELKIKLMFLGFTFIYLLVMCLVIYGIYSLVYGILLKRLKRNYKELSKIEM